MPLVNRQGTLLNDIANALNSLANLQKVQVEKTKVKTQKANIRRVTKENKELKKALSRNQIIGIVGIIACRLMN